MPLRLSDGWNQVVLNLADLTRKAYSTTYVETQRGKTLPQAQDVALTFIYLQ